MPAQYPRQPITLPFGKVEGAGRLPDGYDTKVEIQYKVQQPEESNASVADDGIVLTTLPSRFSHQKFGDLPDNWSECFLTGYVKRKILSTKGFPRKLNNPAVSAYRIESLVDAAGWGPTMVATRKIKIGEIICDERPLLVSPVNIGEHIPIRVPSSATQAQIIQATLFESEKFLKVALDRMLPENREAYMALRNCHIEDGSGPIMGVVRTNAFEVGDVLRNKNSREGSDVGKYVGVWKDLSRMRHSCSPNTSRNFSAVSFSMKLRAARDVNEGEEITTSYCTLLCPASERQQALAPYEIACGCPACLNATVSDKRRNSFLNRKSISPPFNPTSPSGGGPETDDEWVQPVVRMIQEMEEEGIQAQDEYRLTLHQALNAYTMMGHEEKAVYYGKKLYASYLALGQGKAYKRYTEVESLKTSPQWGLMRLARGVNGVPPVLFSFA